MEMKIAAANNQADLVIDEKFFPRQVIVQAAYRFIDRCYLRLEREKSRRVRVTLKGKRKLSRRRLEVLAGEFENELLHQLVRDQVAKRTDKVREILVGRALLSAEPVDEAVTETAEADIDYLDDPLGIAVPWEEKYGDGEGNEQEG